jgi:hypothetical protein
MTYLYAGVASFLYVWMRAFQQLNVIHRRHWRIPATSLAMGTLDVLLVWWIVKADSLWIGVCNGIGGMFGCYAAIYLHDRWRG